MTPEHDALLQHLTNAGWTLHQLKPPTSKLDGYCTASRASPTQTTRARWLLIKTPTGLVCRHPNYTIHKR